MFQPRRSGRGLGLQPAPVPEVVHHLSRGGFGGAFGEPGGRAWSHRAHHPRILRRARRSYEERRDRHRSPGPPVPLEERGPLRSPGECRGAPQASEGEAENRAASAREGRHTRAGGFQKKFAEKVSSGSEERDCSSGKPLKVLAFDEARFGLINWHRRRYCPKGFRPPWIVRRAYEWTYLYAAVAPTSGESLCLYLPGMDSLCFQT